MTRRQPTSAPDFDLLVGRISAASDALRREAVASVNRAVTARAWLTGYYIVEYEQHGRDRAKYGERLLPCLSAQLAHNGFSLQNLKNFRRFYLTFQSLAEPVAAYLERAFPAKRQSLPVLFPDTLSAPLLGKSQTASGLLLHSASEGGKPPSQRRPRPPSR